MLCYVMLCYVILCYVMLCYVMLCYVMLCYVILCYVMLCYVMSCHVMSCHVMSCHVMLCYVMLTKLKSVCFMYVLLLTILAHPIPHNLSIFQSNLLLRYMFLFISFCRSTCPFAYNRNFPRATFCTLEVYCSTLTKTNVINVCHILYS